MGEENEVGRTSKNNLKNSRNYHCTVRTQYFTHKKKCNRPAGPTVKNIAKVHCNLRIVAKSKKSSIKTIDSLVV